jgi:hypothetical protein
MDGVPDKHDTCPNTPMIALVDLSGCTIKTLKTTQSTEQHFDVVFGQSYAEDGNSRFNFSSLQVDYYYKNVSLQLTSSYYDASSATQSSSGQNDTYLNLFYQSQPVENFFLSFGGGIAFPTYDSVENKTDYTASLYGRYKKEKWSFLTGLGYTTIGDRSSVSTTSYRNSLFYNVGLGYTWSSKFYSSLGYYRSNSIFEGLEDLESLSLYTYYSIDEHWFTNLNYSHGLSTTAINNSIGVRLGYYW